MYRYDSDSIAGAPTGRERPGHLITVHHSFRATLSLSHPAARLGNLISAHHVYALLKSRGGGLAVWRAFSLQKTRVFGSHPKARAGWPKHLEFKLVFATPRAECDVIGVRLC